MSIYYEYLTEDERSIEIDHMTTNNEFSKLDMLYEMACMRLEQLQKEVEFKVFNESGTYDDLSYLLQEAVEQVAEQKKGIIQKIIDAIKNFFNKITGKTNEIKSSNIPPEELISVPSDLEEKSGMITNAMNKMQNGIAKIKMGDFTGAVDIMSVAAAPVAILTITGGVTYKQIKARKGVEISESMDKAKSFFNGIWDKIQSFIHGSKDDKKLDDAKKCLSPVQKIMNAINSVIDAIKNAIFKKKQTPDGEQKEKESRLLARNNVLEKPAKNGGKFRIDRTTGEIQYFDATGNEVPIDKIDVPSSIIKISQQLKGRAAVNAQKTDKKTRERDEVYSKLAKSRTFTPEETGVKVYIDSVSGHISINNNRVIIPTKYDLNGRIGRSNTKHILKQNGVTGNYDAIINALYEIRQGIKAASQTKKQIAINNDPKQRIREKYKQKKASQQIQIKESANDSISEDNIPILTESSNYIIVENSSYYEIYV